MKYQSTIGFKGTFIVTCYDKDKNIKWEETAQNRVVNEGLNHFLNSTLASGSQINEWYIGLKDTGTVAAGDTLASHGGWSEITAIYTGNRKQWLPDTVSAQSVDNDTNKATFSITGSDTIYGSFICSVNTGSAGTLMAAVDFSAPRDVANSDTLVVTYTMSASNTA